MLSPRDIYPPEWFEDSAAERSNTGWDGPCPRYSARRLRSGCVLLTIEGGGINSGVPRRSTDSPSRVDCDDEPA